MDYAICKIWETIVPDSNTSQNICEIFLLESTLYGYKCMKELPGKLYKMLIIYLCMYTDLNGFKMPFAQLV